MRVLDWLQQPWPWYVAGPLIGLAVPLLLLAGNKSFGISSSLRHICAACIPSRLPFFNYDWKKEAWNLFFVAGIVVGGFIVSQYLRDPNPAVIDPRLSQELARYGLTDYSGLLPPEIFNWASLLSIKGIVFTAVGGFLVGFGTRYAGGCTSGHSIMGLANLQFGSLVATICFMAGGFAAAHLLLPILLSL
jgi:uncharacterized protein